MDFDDSDFSSDMDVGIDGQLDDGYGDSDFTESETPSPPQTPQKGKLISEPRAPWEFEPPEITPTWERLQQWEDINPAMIFSSPLASGPVDLWSETDLKKEAIILYKTPEGYLGKFLAKPSPDNSSIIVKYRTENTLIPTATYPPMSEAETEIILLNYQDENISTYLDVSLGGFAHDPRHYRRAIKERTEDDPQILPPDVAFMHRSDSKGNNVIFASPCRGMLLHIYRSSSRLTRVMQLAKQTANNDNDCVENKIHNLYYGLRRHICETTHFNDVHIDDMWQLFVSSSASGTEDLECGLEVYLSLEELRPFVEKFLPADKFGDDPELNEQIKIFLSSDAFIEGLWWMISSPLGGSSYAAGSPASKKANRKASFTRVMEVLNVAMFGVKDHIVEFLIHLLTPAEMSCITRTSFKSFFESTFPTEDSSELVGLFDEMFVDGDRAPMSMVRYTLTEMDVFQTWNAIILPLLEAKSWSRQNPDL